MERVPQESVRNIESEWRLQPPHQFVAKIGGIRPNDPSVVKEIEDELYGHCGDDIKIKILQTNPLTVDIFEEDGQTKIYEQSLERGILLTN